MSDNCSLIPDLTVAIVGDVHDQWDPEGDRRALEIIGADLVLFVGDFGNEAVDLVQQIANLPIAKAVILGNHDAWYTATDWGRKKSPYDHSKEDRVQAQLDILGETHVGYGCLNLPQFQLSIVGARPFTWGGDKLQTREFLGDRYGVSDFETSLVLMQKMLDACEYENIIFLGHNGPTGLGAEPEDICGRDWNPLGGDFGDPDFEQLIQTAQQRGKNIVFVTFGHMHHTLRHRKDRLRTRTKWLNQTLYINAAQVPRIRQGEYGDRHHSFTVVTLRKNRPHKAELVWIHPQQRTQEKQTLVINN